MKRVKVNTLPRHEQVLSCYEIDEYGNVYSNNYELKQQIKSNGYKQIGLKLDGIRKWKKCYVHRLVALAFLGNPPDGMPEVNHKDEIKSNNFVSNLEWCDRIYNVNYGSSKEKISISNGESCYIYDFRLNYLGCFNSINEASKIFNVTFRGINTRCMMYYCLDSQDISKVLHINRKSNYSSIVITDLSTNEKMYFYSNRQARKFFNNTVNITDAIKYNWTVHGKYKVRNLNYKRLIDSLDL